MKRLFYFASIFLFLCQSPTYAGIKFTEVYPAPESGSTEWVEIFNDGSESVDLTKYKIFDLTGNNVVVRTLILEPQSYTFATSSSVINNSGDTLFLRDDKNEVVHTVTTPRDITSLESYMLCHDDWLITEIITKGMANEPACATPTTVPTSQAPTPQTSPTLTPKPSALPSYSPTPSLVVKPSISPLDSPPMPTQHILSAQALPFTIVTRPNPTPTPEHTGKVYSLEPRPQPPFLKFVKVGTVVGLLSCSFNFLYSMYRYKYVYT